MCNLVIFRMLQNLTRSLFLLALLILTACQNQQHKTFVSAPNACQYSQYLKIWPNKNGFDIAIQNPDQPRLVQTLHIDKPYERIAVLSTTHVGMLTALQQHQSLCAIPDQKFLFDHILKKRIQEKKLTDLRMESAMIDAEKILQSNAQVVVYSGFGFEDQSLKRLKSTGMMRIANYEWREQTPLARAEWILLFGALTGKFKEAQRLHKQVVSHYNLLKLQALKNNRSNQLPIAISGNLYGDQWIAPAGDSFEAKLYKDAGIAYVFSEEPGNGSCFKSLASVLQKAAAINLWLNPCQASKEALLQINPKARMYPFFKKPIYCYTASSTNKYWELAVVRPDWVLSDYIQIAQNRQKKMHFYTLLK